METADQLTVSSRIAAAEPGEKFWIVELVLACPAEPHSALAFPGDAGRLPRNAVVGGESHRNVPCDASEMRLPTCRDVSELVTDHLEHTLPPVTRLGVRWHLLLCPACRRYFAQMRAILRLLAARRLPAPSPQVEARMLARLRQGDDDNPA